MAFEIPIRCGDGDGEIARGFKVGSNESAIGLDVQRCGLHSRGALGPVRGPVLRIFFASETVSQVGLS